MGTSQLHVRMSVCADPRQRSLVAYLSSRIDNLGSVVLSLKPDHFAKGVLDGRVVALDEVAIDELYSEGGFACWWGPASALPLPLCRWAIECLHTSCIITNSEIVVY